MAEVTQADREVAAQIYDLLGFGPCQHIIDGIEDDIGVVQIAARHRNQSTAALMVFKETYDMLHEAAVSMGYPSATEALEHLSELRAAALSIPSEVREPEAIGGGEE